LRKKRRGGEGKREVWEKKSKKTKEEIKEVKGH